MVLAEGIGWALLASGSFFTAIGFWVLYERRRSADYPGTVEQARRGIAIYGVAALVGLVLVLTQR
ncbi:MAG TPA: hypothetical protein VM121_05760 [Acidimicrobiales bacterium]|nr:hypothetical protein [Acidimicrobiales bacterium]